jgi:hypothetical protein
MDLREPPSSPLIIFFVISHKGYTQMSFCLETPKLGVPKFPKLGLVGLWKAINSLINLLLK